MNTINLDYVNGYLNAMYSLNLGPNHGCDFFIHKLENMGSLHNNLAHYYESLTKNASQYYDASYWHISEHQIDKENFTQSIERWFLNLNYSPIVNKENSLNCVYGFFDSLLPAVLNRCYLYEIKTKPPIWYEIDWQDFVIIHQNEYYFLHFGFSD